jgi:hypothetical protein
VRPALPDAEDRLVLPGNRRLRIFHFGRGLVRVVLKAGYDPATMEREVALRTDPAAPLQPFPQIRASGANPHFFDERILDGYALPRCPPWLSRRRVVDRAFGLLDEWLTATRQASSIDDYLQRVVGELEGNLALLQQRLGLNVEGLRHWGQVLAERARQADEVVLAQSHGDFQPGNVLLDRRGRRVWLIDWEHSRRRSFTYDYFVYGLSTRSGSGLATRLRAFVEGSVVPRGLSPREVTGRPQRAVALARFLLEDLAWVVAESAQDPLRAASAGLVHYQRALARFDRDLAQLVGRG